MNWWTIFCVTLLLSSLGHLNKASEAEEVVEEVRGDVPEQVANNEEKEVENVEKSQDSSDQEDNDVERKGECAYQQPHPTGSPCANGYIQWNEPKVGYYVPGHDLAAKGGMTAETCKEFCWTYPGCVGIDITTTGVCYLNHKYTVGLAQSTLFTMIDFSCCKTSQPQCEQKKSAEAHAGPCYSNSAKFVDYIPAKYVPGNDLKVLTKQTVETCRQACWDTPFCLSADITRDGVCYLNSVAGPANGESGTFSFIGFDCCPGPQPECLKSEKIPTGGPCPNRYVRWADPQMGTCQPGNDITAKGGLKMESCRAFCLTYPGCVSADLYLDGTCYLNFKKDTVRACPGFMYLDFECCSNFNDRQCKAKTPVPTGSPCPSGQIKWNYHQPTKYVPGNDLASKGGMTIKTCKEFCWSYPGCVSADLAYNGDCYLNSVAGPVSTSSIFSLLEYECCDTNPPKTCEKRPSKAGGSGPCYSGSAKFLDYQPGKYIIGHDIKVEANHNVASCRQLCWDTAGCQSADLTNAGVCYLNNVRGPVSKSGYFSFIDIECCDPSEPTCEYKPAHKTGGPCPNGHIQWTNPKRGICQWGNDITSRGGMTMETCRDLCLTYPGCTGVDITSGGACYINFKKEPLTPCNDFTNSNLYCCSNVSNSKCEAKEPVATGSPCASGQIQWKDPQPTKYVPGQDIISKGGMTIQSCQDFCWSYPGCASADLTYDGVCYLNYANKPIAESTLFTLLEYDCCKSKQPVCKRRDSKANGNGPCGTNIAKFLDYQPGKYIIGHDIKVETGHSIESCRQLCWDTPQCKSADLTQGGICYLNNVREPLSDSFLFNFIDFQCCTEKELEDATSSKVPVCTPETKVDITFVIDCSGSIGENNFFKGLIPAVQGIINLMIPGAGDQSTKTRVAAVSFASNAILEWPLDKYTTKDELIKAVGKIPFYASTTATGDALNMVLTQVHPTVRAGVKHLVILITDGVQNDGKYKDSEEAEKLKNVGANVFVIGVGDEIDKATLDKLASGPEYRADVKNYEDLRNKMQSLAAVTCKQAV